MRGVGGRPAARGVVFVAAASLLVWSPAPVAAADDATVVLPDAPYASLTADLDGDSIREVVRIVQSTRAGARVDAWEYGAEGWVQIGSEALVADREGVSRPVDLNRGGSGLMTWRVGGEERVLVFAAHADFAHPPPNLLGVSIFEADADDGGLFLRRLSAPSDLMAASGVQAADLDGDGSDELVFTEWAADGVPQSQIVRWSGERFEFVFDDAGAEAPFGPLVGDSDGHPGDELVFGPAPDGHVERHSWVDGRLVVETVEMAIGSAHDVWPAGATGGVIILATPGGVQVLRWPRGEGLTAVGAVETPVYPGVQLLGEGEDALIAVFDPSAAFEGREQEIEVYDLGLRRLGSVLSSPVATALSVIAGGERQPLYTFDRPLFPFTGSLPGGWTDGRPAFLANGVLVQADGEGGLASRAISSLAGVQPVGLAGPDAGWIALTNGYLGAAPRQAWLGGGFRASDGQLMLAPVERLLGADDAEQIASVELRQAVETGAAVDGVRPLAAEGDGFEVLVDAPEGSTVFLANGFRSHDALVTQAPLRLEVEPPRRREREQNQPLSVGLVVVTPEGRVSVTRWEGLFIREAPTVEVEASTEPFALRARLEGQATPGTAVSVEGASVQTDADGRFAIDLDAPIWPVRVVVVARDPLGNETTEVIEVVGFVDYRGLPWLALVAIATLVAGVVLFLRVPRARRDVAPERVPADGDARLEEIEI